MPIIKKGAGRDKRGDFTTECAKDTNRWLDEHGIDSYGNAYQIGSQFRTEFNGYPRNGRVLPEFPRNATKSDSSRVIMDYHRKASDNVKNNFDIDDLDKDDVYVVNMYYNSSPHIVPFYNDAVENDTRNYGTHVGRAYWDKDKKDWFVEHNIHGDIYIDRMRDIMGGLSNPHPYGITAIYNATKPTVKTWARGVKNQFVDWLRYVQP